MIQTTLPTQYWSACLWQVCVTFPLPLLSRLQAYCDLHGNCVSRISLGSKSKTHITLLNKLMNAIILVYFELETRCNDSEKLFKLICVAV
jgi:hypothetical protein